MDIEVNPYYTFAYDCSDIDTVGGIHDFYSVLLHELGHCHMLEHNIEEDEIMFTTWNEYVDAPDFSDIAGGNNVIEFSLGWQSTGSCSPIMIHDTVSCKTDFVKEFATDKGQIIVYPTPFFESFSIDINEINSTNLYINIDDLTGRNIFIEKITNNRTVAQPNVITVGMGIPPGPYILRITTEGKVFSTIIIKG